MVLAALPASSTATVQVRDGQIVYLDTSVGQLFTRNLDGSNVQQLTFPPGGAADPAFSPDGQTIAYNHGGDGSGIWLMSSDGSDQRPLATDQVGQWSFQGPSWSLDGSRIAYARMAPGEGGGTDIWVMDSDGSHQRNVTNDHLFNFLPAYSPDGVHVAFSASDQNGPPTASGIYDVDITSGQEQQLTQDAPDNAPSTPPSYFSDESPDYSPDGSQIAFSRCGWWTSKGPQCVIFTMDSDGSNQEAITPLEVDGTVFSASDPAWSADGTQLTFVAYLGSALPAPPPFGQQQQGPFLYVINTDGSGLAQLPNSTGAKTPVWQSVYSKRDSGCRGKGHLIAGAAGPNLLRGSTGSDVVDAGRGADRVIGRSGDDTLCGGQGADRLVGGPGADKLVGGPGKDILIGGPGKDRIVSGPGDVVRP
jgi:Tol biopolymer transport system component